MCVCVCGSVCVTVCGNVCVSVCVRACTRVCVCGGGGGAARMASATWAVGRDKVRGGRGGRAWRERY